MYPRTTFLIIKKKTILFFLLLQNNRKRRTKIQLENSQDPSSAQWSKILAQYTGTYPKSTRGDWKLRNIGEGFPREVRAKSWTACVSRREFCVRAKKALRTQTYRTGVYMHGPRIVRLEVGQMPAGNARQMYHYLGLTVAMQLESVNRDPHHVTPTRLSWRQQRGWGEREREARRSGERRMNGERKRVCDEAGRRNVYGERKREQVERRKGQQPRSNRRRRRHNNNNNEARGRESAKGSLPSTLLFPPFFFLFFFFFFFFRRSSWGFLFTSGGGVPCFVPLGALWTVTEEEDDFSHTETIAPRAKFEP